MEECVNSFGTELIFETEPHKAVYSWRDDYGSCIEIPQGSIKKLIGRELSWNDEPVELKENKITMDVILLTIMILIAVICVAAAIVSIVSLVMYFIEEYKNVKEKLNDIL